MHILAVGSSENWITGKYHLRSENVRSNVSGLEASASADHELRRQAEETDITTMLPAHLRLIYILLYLLFSPYAQYLQRRQSERSAGMAEPLPFKESSESNSSFAPPPHSTSFRNGHRSWCVYMSTCQKTCTRKIDSTSARV